MLDEKFLEKFTRKFVVEHLSYNGGKSSIMSDEDIRHCYTLADGFGSYDDQLAKYFEGGYDWSHIRDSSDAAFFAIAAWLWENVWYKKTPFKMHVAQLIGECVLGRLDPNMLLECE